MTDHMRLRLRDEAEAFAQHGYTLVRGLFSTEEASFYCDHFMRLRAAGSYPGDVVGVDPAADDPLRRYPRMIHMQRWDAVSKRWLIEPRLNEILTALLGGLEPFAVQTMLYFKPPGARGQAPHQDNFYLRAQPGTCIAAWLALDRSDDENGCLQVVPGSQSWPILCTVDADTTQSFTDITVPLPDDAELASMLMEPGDALFFNGSLVHGSGPNRSRDRFRRALVAHYVQGDAEQVARWYHPVLRMDGTEVELGTSEGGGPCGEWTEVAGERAIALTGTIVESYRTGE
jgi:phytanoyl-CoA hydroxylase